VVLRIELEPLARHPGGRVKVHRARGHLRAPHASSAPRPSPGAPSVAALLLCGGCT
jgi:hypothetical protein